MTYRNFRTSQLVDETWLCEVNILTPKAFTLQYSHAEEIVAMREILKYLESQNATEEFENKLDTQGGGDIKLLPNA